ncbi:MAG TPA: hypothetical protein VLU94_00560, partial [Candidatus Nitrosotalea sp.]|nr:hypothetical protein [Candidatus Nitrosotalea sp.]
TITNRILTDGTIIMQLLTLPKYVVKGSVLLTNLVYANVRAISGSAVDKGTNATTRDFAFAYQLKSEVIPLSTYPPGMTNFLAAGLPAAEILTRSNLWRVANNQATNFTELRLTLQGPILRKGGGIQVAGTPRTFRAVLNGWRQDNFNTIHPNLFIQVQ